MNNLSPDMTVSPNVASSLTGRSAEAIRRLIELGALEADCSGHWVRIPLGEIERLRGEPVTAEDYGAALCEQEAQRSYWRGRHRLRRASK